MKTAYKRLYRNHRIEIEKLIALGKNNNQIASTQSVHPSTISMLLMKIILIALIDYVALF